MTKAELIAALAEQTGETRANVERVLDALESVATYALKQGGEMTIPGLVKLGTKARAARTGRNPRTGEAMEIPAKTVVTAKVATALSKALA